MEAKKWWKEAIGYQIYPKSFKDSNGDGIGDIPGIISKLDYLQELGVTLLWLCPIYRSPMDDNGYDVSDFFDIDPQFGTLQDVEELIEQVHRRGMHIIFDLVLNHTSDEHPWFIESRKSKDNPYRDYYLWQDPKDGKEPNNLASFFGGSCWNYDETTKQYYMKIFSNKMPDLNWANEKVRHSMQEMAKWWLDKGIDGFRIDAVAHIARDLTFSDCKQNPNDEYSYEWGKFSNLPKLHDYLKEMNEKVFSQYDIVTVGECGGGASIEDALKYAGYDSHELDMCFTFDHCWENGAYGAERKTQAEIITNVLSLKKQFNRWQKGMYQKSWNPLYWLNHDHPRVISQYGDPKHFFKESGKMLCNTLYFMWGTPFIYNGEEIGMSNVDYTNIEQFKDNSIQDYFEQAQKRGISKEQIFVHLRRSSRVNARTPMQWSTEANAGFSSHTPWIDVVGTYHKVNVKQQLEDPDSIFRYYQKALKFRKEGIYKNTIIYGSFDLVSEKDPNVFAYVRKKDKTIMIISNFRNYPVDFNVNGYRYLQTLLSNYPDNKNLHLKAMTLRPFESIVLEVEQL